MTKITGIQVVGFTYQSSTVRDEEGHAHPGPEHQATGSLTKIQTDQGVEGYCFGGSTGLATAAEPILLGEDPFNRERIWQRLRHFQRMDRGNLSDRNIGVIDQALWDLVGRILDRPVYKLLGAYRDKVPAYASTMCGDDLPGGLNTPAAYAEFALACKEQGYPAFKLHTWQPPYSRDPRRDVAACAAVRAAVGPDMHLMLDSYHYYSREEALYIGRALEELDYHWFEEPMDEHSISSYIWLTQSLSIPVVGPETAGGGIYTRAEWIKQGASDISRYDVNHGGITAHIKAVHLCEAFGVALEVHGGGASHLQILGAMGIPGEYYERGLLHPFLDHDAKYPWLAETVDPLDADGCVPIPQGPGLGEVIDWDFIERNKI